MTGRARQLLSQCGCTYDCPSRYILGIQVAFRWEITQPRKNNYCTYTSSEWCLAKQQPIGAVKFTMGNTYRIIGWLLNMTQNPTQFSLRTCAYTRVQARARACALTQTSTHTQIHTHIHIDKRLHTRATAPHTHTHTRTEGFHTGAVSITASQGVTSFPSICCCLSGGASCCVRRTLFQRKCSTEHLM